MDTLVRDRRAQRRSGRGRRRRWWKGLARCRRRRWRLRWLRRNRWRWRFRWGRQHWARQLQRHRVAGFQCSQFRHWRHRRCGRSRRSRTRRRWEHRRTERVFRRPWRQRCGRVRRGGRHGRKLRGHPLEGHPADDRLVDERAHHARHGRQSGCSRYRWHRGEQWTRHGRVGRGRCDRNRRQRGGCTAVAVGARCEPKPS